MILLVAMILLNTVHAAEMPKAKNWRCGDKIIRSLVKPAGQCKEMKLPVKED